MNLKKILVTFTLLFGICSFAQNKINFGVKAGTNFTGFHTGKSAGTNIIGINIGGMAEYEISDSFSIQTELLYNSKGGKVLGDGASLTNFGFDALLDYIDIPIQGKFYFLKGLSFDFGGQFGVLINSRAELYNGEKTGLDNTKSFDFSANGGFSYKFENGLIIQTRYNFGLTKIFEEERYKNSMISLSLGYFFN